MSLYFKVNKKTNIIGKVPTQNPKASDNFYYLLLPDTYKFPKLNGRYDRHVFSLSEELPELSKEQVTRTFSAKDIEYKKKIKQKLVDEKKVRNWKERVAHIDKIIRDKKITVEVPKLIIKKISDGEITHLYTKEECAELHKIEINKKIDESSYNSIKRWCKNQPEGCEEAFINIGILDKNDSRFLVYLDKKKQIIENNKKQKKELKGLLSSKMKKEDF